MTVVKLDYKVEKKDVTLETLYNDLKAVIEENEIDERVERVEGLLQRRMPNFRRNVKRNELKKIVEEKVKEQNKKEFSKGKVAAKINQIWYLVSKKYDALKEGDKKIEDLMNEVEKAVKKVDKQSRRSNIDQNKSNFIIEQIVELNIRLNQQHELLEDHNKEIYDLIDGLSETSLKRDDGSNVIKPRADNFSGGIHDKDAILKEKYSRLEESVNELENIRNEAEETRKKLEEAKKEPPIDELVMMDENEEEVDFKQADKKAEGAISDQLGRIGELKEDIKKKDAKIKELQKSNDDWTTLAHKCKCFYKGFFNKKCRY